MKDFLNNHPQITVDFEDNWIIFLKEIQFSFKLALKQRQNIMDWPMKLFTSWLIDDEIFEITFEEDPPWDSSGKTVKRNLKKSEIAAFLSGTLKEWMETYTGNWTASYESGCGKYHETYEEEIQRHISEKLYEFLKLQAESEEKFEEICNSYEWEKILIDLEEVFFYEIASIPSLFAYRKFEEKIHKENIEENLDTEKNRKRLWNSLNLSKKIHSALAEAGPELLEAISKVGLPGNFSDSISAEIQNIVNKYLSNDNEVKR